MQAIILNDLFMLPVCQSTHFVEFAILIGQKPQDKSQVYNNEFCRSFERYH